MANNLGRGTALLGGLLTMSALSLFGGGNASAQDPLIGKTYEEATAEIKNWTGKPVRATIVGDGLELEKCIVSAWRKDKKTGKFFLSLNCGNKIASAKDSGNSLASPEGRAQKRHDDTVDWLHQHPEHCLEMKAEHPEWFKKPMDGCEGVV
jgi:hypothetical protein